MFIKLPTALLAKAAKATGTTPEKFIAKSRSIALGRRVCAHLEKIEGRFSVFSLVDSVRTPQH